MQHGVQMQILYCLWKRVEDANGRNSQIFPCLPSLVHICNGISKSRRETIKEPIMLQLSLVMVHIHVDTTTLFTLFPILPRYHVGSILTGGHGLIITKIFSFGYCLLSSFLATLVALQYNLSCVV